MIKDGSLLFADYKAGRFWRIAYAATRRLIQTNAALFRHETLASVCVGRMPDTNSNGLRKGDGE
jgi:hypothetical protein